ncbi:MAG: amidase [Chloroflexi bacterium]|nr:amidase [Chloroflexota bacterium]
MSEPHNLTVVEAAHQIRTGKRSPIELTEALLARIERSQPALRTFVTVDAEGARAAARAADAAVRSGHPLGPLHGVPFAVKDIFNAAGLPTVAGYAPFEENLAQDDAHAVARLKAAGAVLLGKTVTTQFASADPSPTVNPWRADRTPGGSSSGSGASVGARLVPLALGTQTGGSILRPAAYNGAVGLKPTYGRVSRHGILPLAWSLDHAGPIVRTVHDAALVLEAIAGHDPRDPHALDAPVANYSASLREPISPPRLALLTDLLERAEPAVAAHVEALARQCERAGATVERLALPADFDLYLAVHGITNLSEAAEVHADALGRDRSAYHPRIRSTTMLGQVLPAWAYLHAQRLRRQLAAQTTAFMAPYDALLLPTASNLPPGRDTTGDPSFQSPWSLLGLPSISLPSGISADGLPFAVQLVSRRLEEPTLFRAAAWVEREVQFQARPPEAW